MKTHLPHKLRAALMATLAAVSITTGYATADEYGLQFWQDDGKTATSVKVNKEYFDYVVPDGTSDLKFVPDTSYSRDNVKRLQVLANTNHTGAIYATAEDAPWGYSSSYETYLIGIGQNRVQDGDLYFRSVTKSTTGYKTGVVIFVDIGATVKGDTYVGLAGPNTYGGAVIMDKGGTITGSSKLEIAGGTYDRYVTAGIFQGTNDSYIGGNIYSRISGGTFNGEFVAAGNYASKGTPTIKGTATTYILGGTFNTTVYGGSATNGNGTIEGGVTLSITGGTFGDGRSVYALGNAGTVKGAVNLTIGNNAKFSGNNVISAGTNGTATYTGSPSAGTPSQVTLKNLTGTSSLATDRTITVDGGAQKSWLVMENVDTTIKARLTNFSSMSVQSRSNLTLNSATNAGLGGASSVYIDSSSTLTLDSGESGSSWDWNLNGRTITGEGTLKLKGEGALSITDNTYLFTKVDMGSGTLSVDNTMQDKEIKAVSGSGTLAKTGAGKTTVKDASGFTGKIDAAGWGTLQLEKVDLTGAKAPQKVSVSNGATVNLIDVNQGTDGASIELSIAGGTFGVYANDQDPAAGNVGNLTLAGGSKITIGTGTSANVLEANLVTLSGSILDFTSGGQLTMGCTLDVQEGTIVLLNADDFDGLKNGTLESVTLFNGIDNETMDAANVIICRGAQEGAEQLTAQVDFHTDGTLSVKGVPEPATGTLSLLALAGLAARRRRKH